MKTLQEEFETFAKQKPWFVPDRDGKERDDVEYVYADFLTDMCWVSWQQSRAVLAQEAGKCEGRPPLGAIENGRAFMERVEQLYGFKDVHGHQIANCSDWQQFVRCFEYLADHTSQTALVSVEFVEIFGKVLSLFAPCDLRGMPLLIDARACLDKVKELNQ